MGTNIGNEVNGTGDQYDRPVLVIRPFNAQTFFGVALSGRRKSGPYYFPLGVISEREAIANLSQVRLYDTKRLLRKIETLDEVIFEALCEKLSHILFPVAISK
jgi:mRNA-degrading endonuclease toxin of MazEF toxin-antitoxin module